MKRTKKTRCTSAQIIQLINYMDANRQFANGDFNGLTGQQSHLQQWAELKNMLNNFGPDKTVGQWRLTWRDLKRTARVESSQVKHSQAQTGNITAPNLSERSKKILKIIGAESNSNYLKETGIGEAYDFDTKKEETSEDDDDLPDGEHFMYSGTVDSSLTPSKYTWEIIPTVSVGRPSQPLRPDVVDVTESLVASRLTTRSTNAQIKQLVEHMDANRRFANGDCTGPMGLQANFEQWMQLKNMLSTFGPDKSVEQWRHTWRDLKKRARDESARMKNAQGDLLDAETGDITRASKVSSRSKKILEIIGYEGDAEFRLEETGVGEAYTSDTNDDVGDSGNVTDGDHSYSGDVTSHVTPPTKSERASLPRTASLSRVSQPSRSETPSGSVAGGSNPSSRKNQPPRPKRKHQFTAKEFLDAEKVTAGILKDISDQLRIKNHMAAGEARRRYNERLRARRYCFKFD